MYTLHIVVYELHTHCLNINKFDSKVTQTELLLCFFPCRGEIFSYIPLGIGPRTGIPIKVIQNMLKSR